MADVEFEEHLAALETLESLAHDRDAFIQLRLINGPQIKKTRIDLEKKSSLKSDLKKSTAFVKKIKSITPEGLLQCIKDVEALNLSLYISEIVLAIVETNFKSTDVPAIVRLCVLLHQRYEDFTAPLLDGIRRSLLSDDLATDEKDSSGKRKRIQMRLLLELFQSGVMRDEEFFLTLLRVILGKNAQGTKRGVIDLAGLVTFTKYSAELLLGHIPKKIIALAKKASKSISEIPILIAASPSISYELGVLTSEAVEQVTSDLVRAFADWKKLEKKAEKDRAIHGSLSEQKQLELDDNKKLYEKLLSSLSSMSEVMDITMPVLKEEKDVTETSGGISVWDNSAVNVDYGPFGDAESKAFYDELPDLLVMVPLNALGLTTDQASALREQWRIQKESEFLQPADEAEIIMSMDKRAVSGEDVDPSAIENASVTASGGVASIDDDSVGDSSGATTSNSAKLNILLNEKLPDCNSKQKADDFSVAFCYCSSKKTRKTLIAALLKVPKGRAELIPSYARIVASLSRVFPDISEPILSSLYGDFIGKFRSKFQFNFEDKVKTVRFIGELVKFRIAPPIMALKIFNTLITDFFNQNVLLCSILLETCGRYLYLMPFTHSRIETILDSCLRMRRAKNLDSNQQMALEAAYFTVKPPERVARQQKQLTVLQKYIRHLFFTVMSNDVKVIDGLIKQLRMLPWSDTNENVEGYVIKTALKVAKTKYVDIPLVADTLAGLAKYHSRLHVRMIDAMNEEFCRGMDSPHKREPQKLLGLARLLGEFFNFALINSSVVFEFLYLFLNYGHEVQDIQPVDVANIAPESSNADILALFKKKYDPAIPSGIDSPTDLFRAQLVCELIRSVSAYFIKGVLQDRLKRFLLHFQKYLFFKTSLPNHVEFTILDLFDELETLVIANVMKDKTKDKKKMTKEAKMKMSQDISSMALSFPRFETLEAVQVELDKISGDNSGGGAAEQDEDEEKDGDDLPNDAEKEADGGANAEEDVEEDTEDSVEAEEQRREAEARLEAEISEANAAQLMAKLRLQEQEDDEFERAFKSAMQESVTSAKGSAGPAGGGGRLLAAVNRMAMPAVLPKPKNMQTEVDREDYDDDEDDDTGEDRSAKKKVETVKFKLLSRDSKGRLETRQFDVEKESEMVARLEKAGEQQKLERQKLKETVLRYEKANASGAASAMPVAYLGGRDHYGSNRPAQPFLASTSYRGGGGESTATATSVPAGAKTLNLSEFLADSQAQEVRRIQQNVGRGNK